MTSVLSFSLFRGPTNISPYLLGLRRLVETVNLFYPCWRVDLFVSTELADAGRQAEDAGLHVVWREPVQDYGGTMWRLLSLLDDNEVVLFRDLDSRFSWRELHLVNLFLCSDRNVHVMRDHQYHTNPILAGLWGIKKVDDYIRAAVVDVLAHGTDFGYGCDEGFLASVVYPHVRDSIMLHDSSLDSGPFLAERDGYYLGRKLWV